MYYMGKSLKMLFSFLIETLFITWYLLERRLPTEHHSHTLKQVLIEDLTPVTIIRVNCVHVGDIPLPD